MPDGLDITDEIGSLHFCIDLWATCFAIIQPWPPLISKQCISFSAFFASLSQSFIHSFILDIPSFLDLDISSFIHSFILNILSFTYSFIYSFISIKHTLLFKIDNLLIISGHLYHIHPSISIFHLSLTHSLTCLFVFILSFSHTPGCMCC